MVIYQNSSDMRVFANENGNYELVFRGQKLTLPFHNGKAKDGFTGLTAEALLAAVIHRAEKQNELLPSFENQRAISHLKSAMSEFDARTISRMIRGVEGEHLP